MHSASKNSLSGLNVTRFALTSFSLFGRAIRLPSGLNATPVTVDMCPFRLRAPWIVLVLVREPGIHSGPMLLSCFEAESVAGLLDAGDPIANEGVIADVDGSLRRNEASGHDDSSLRKRIVGASFRPVASRGSMARTPNGDRPVDVSSS